MLRCPFCQQATVPTLPMARAVREAIDAFHDEWAHTFEAFHERRQRELELFEDRQRTALEAFGARLKKLALREHVPGAPVKRKPFFSF